MTIIPLIRGILSTVAATLAVTGVAQAAPARATVVIGGKPVPFIVSPYVGDNGEVYAPVDAVRLLGASYSPDTGAQTVTVSGTEGRTITVPYQLVQGRYCVPLQKVAQTLGANTDWQPTSQTLTLRARLLMVRQDERSLAIYTSYPVYYTVRRLDKPNRLFVDVYGLDLAAQPANIPVTGSNVLHVRSGQLEFNTVRIVVDLRKNLAFQIRSPMQSNRVEVALGVGRQAPYDGGPAPVTPMPVTPPVAVVSRPQPHLPVVAPSDAIHITGITYKSDGALTQVLVSTTGEAKYTTEMLANPRRLAFDLAGASLDMDQRQISTAGNPIMKQVRFGVFRDGDSRFGRVVLDLARSVPFTVTHQPGPDGGTIYAINLQGQVAARPLLPFPAGGGLAGKIIVVDPGHGYQDSGAVGIGGVREKDLVLAVGLKLRDTLRQNGATVFMTRDDDSFLSVEGRPRFAINHHADLFVSIHCDSAPVEGRAGTMVYFHANNPICRRMAADISARIAETSGIPQDGIRSDMTQYGGRFATGYGVLRGSPMPAVLVECGFVSNLSDLRKLQDQDTQQRVADGIVAGLRDFIGGRTASR